MTVTKNTKPSPPPNAPLRRITIKRMYKATVKDVWDLWTTRKGFESWWGPDGFTARC
jgi:uncharacterized protein YndB with AHSA1/START domain